ncbi:hypothetical protein [Sphaerothrix gracilis]|uniref:hypothetical protein n=1 Tax=Sphaerothrix gracilis TaxID=3151835 RepID=UPI0031FC4940
MPVPPSEFEHLQSSLMLYYNREVRKAFREDISDDDYASPEAVLRNNCLIKDNDTAAIMTIKMLNFFMVRQNRGLLDEIIYGIPAGMYDEVVTYRPQVILHFEEPTSLYDPRAAKEVAAGNVKPRRKRVRASFRYMNATAESFSSAEKTRVTNAINQQFPISYKFKTGRLKLSYKDKQHGLELVVAPYTKAEGLDFIKRILDVRPEVPFNEEFLSESVSGKNFNKVERKQILGKQYQLPKRRPIATVKLKRADLHLHGMMKPVILLERYI